MGKGVSDTLEKQACPTDSARLLEKGKLLEMIETNISDFIAILDTQGIIRYASPSHYKIFGIPAAAVVGKSALDLVHPDDAPFIQERFAELVREEPYYDPIEVRYRNAQGLWLVIEVRGNTILHQGLVTAIVIIVREISRRKNDEAFIHYMAYHDALTGLPNRAAFYEKLESYIDRASHNDELTALIMLDLDEFKQINDTYGHIVGDHLLRAVARTLENLAEPFGYVARLAGDEFVVIMPHIRALEDIAPCTVDILEALRTGVSVQEATFFVTASIGVSFHPSHGNTVDELLSKADQEQYVAKRRGKNQCVLACEPSEDPQSRAGHLR